MRRAPAAASAFVLAALVLAAAGASAPFGSARTGGSPPPDTMPPALSGVPSGLVAEAEGPGGSAVSYPLPSAADASSGPVPVFCSPPPGSTFPLGSSSVACSAADSAGNVATASFSVLVRDTTPPVLNTPPEVVVDATGASGVPAGEPAVAALLSGVTASDLVDPSPAVSNDAPAVFPVGTTTVTFTATDAAGNSSAVSAAVRVRAPGAASGTTSVATLVAALRPPPNVRALRARSASRSVVLDWKPPARKAAFEYVITRRQALGAGARASVVYRGRRTGFTDRGLRNGVSYRYTVFTLDRAGNTSAGVVVSVAPRASRLARPSEGEAVRPPVELAWVPARGADYYNVQLYRLAGRGPAARRAEKVLTAWPESARLTLAASWSFDGRAHDLRRGHYAWYVWPGFGPKADARYGPLLGVGTFVVRGPSR